MKVLGSFHLIFFCVAVHEIADAPSENLKFGGPDQMLRSWVDAVSFEEVVALVGAYDSSCIERIDENVAARPLVHEHKVDGHVYSVEGQMQSSCEEDDNHTKHDGQSLPAVNYAVQVGVVGVVIVFCIPPEAKLLEYIPEQDLHFLFEGWVVGDFRADLPGKLIQFAFVLSGSEGGFLQA